MNKLDQYFNQDALAASVWQGKYALANEQTPDDMHRRLAKEFARIEADEIQKESILTPEILEKLSEYGRKRKDLTEEEIYELFKDFKYIVPQGSVMSGVGNPLVSSLSNCVVIGQPYDSVGGIMTKDEEFAQLFKRRCGVGLDISTLRPNNAGVTNAAKTTTGAISFMERYSNTTREIAQMGRRGATMLSIDIRHPDVEDFATIKQDPTKVTGANVSIQLRDDFMQAVKDNEDYVLRWPCELEIESTNGYFKGLQYDELISDQINGNKVYYRKVKAKNLWDTIIKCAHNTAEPGLLFLDKHWDRSPDSVYPEYKGVTTNPCFHEDTLIAVADGRNAVSIKQLAEEGNDVPVYSVDKKTGLVSIKMGRNPRITGYNKQLVRVHLDKKSHIDVTPDHKFILLNGEEKEAKDLKVGDSLPRFNKVLEPVKTGGNDYYRVHTNVKSATADKIFEHRLIAKFYYENEWNELYDECKKDGFMAGGVVVHHKDYNPLNNSPQNLQIMTYHEHKSYHANRDTQGEKNGRYSGITNEEIKEFALELTRNLGRKFSHCEWQKAAKENGYPMHFSKFRGFTVKGLSDWCAIKLGLQTGNMRLIKLYEKAIEQGYDATLTNSTLTINKKCEQCGNDFSVNYLRREQAFCSQSCSCKYQVHTAEYKEGQKKSYETKKALQNITKDKQAAIYSQLLFDLGRPPKQKEWEKACQSLKVPFRVGKTLKLCYKNYQEVKQAGSNYNHKVTGIEYLDGEHTVYNITVDDNHTVGIVTEINEKRGNKWFSGIYTPQCGEIFMQEGSTCRLIANNLYSYVVNPFTENAYFDFESFYEKSYEQQRLTDDLVTLEIEHIDRILDKIKNDPEPDYVKARELRLWETIKQSALNDRRTGSGFTALGDTLAALNLKYDADEALNMIDKIMATKMEAELDCTIDMAITRGTFTGWNVHNEYEYDDKNGVTGTNDFFQFILEKFPEQANRMMKYGRRNVSFSTTAPTGSLSILTQTTSGIEPIFMVLYYRRKKINPADKGVRVDFVDQNGDKWQEYAVLHPKFITWYFIKFGQQKQLASIIETKEYLESLPKTEVEEILKISPWYGSTANDINWLKRVEIQGIVQNYTTHSISSTINLPNDVSVEEVSDIYMHSWEQGLKGVTVYRDGCRTGVLISKPETKDTTFHPQDAIKRPKELPCYIHHITTNKQPFTVIVGMLDNNPYEVFALPGTIMKNYSNGFLTKKKKGVYTLTCSLDEEYSIITDITSDMTEEQETITRLVSGMLRHGANVKFVTEQLQKTNGVLTSFTKAIARVLKTYIPDGEKASTVCSNCGGTNVVFEEGCSVCKDCGHSKCG